MEIIILDHLISFCKNTRLCISHFLDISIVSNTSMCIIDDYKSLRSMPKLLLKMVSKTQQKNQTLLELLMRNTFINGHLENKCIESHKEIMGICILPIIQS